MSNGGRRPGQRLGPGVQAETRRVIKRKQIQIPGGGTVDVPVITQIMFKDHIASNQETQFTINNSAQAHRDVHVAEIQPDSDTTIESPANVPSGSGGGDNLQVERVDLWRNKDKVERGQQTYFKPDNKDVNEPPDAPPYFYKHDKTHIVRYINTPDDGNSIDSELIDEFRFKDDIDRGQQTYYTLSNPPQTTDIPGITVGDPVEGTNDGTGAQIVQIQVDPTLDDISDTDNGIDPPWRLDPFQNIVKTSGGVGVIGCFGEYNTFYNAAGYMIGSKDAVLWKDNQWISTGGGSHPAVWDAAYGDGVWIGYDMGEVILGIFQNDPASGYILQSTDQAKTWQRIAGPLNPAGAVIGPGGGERIFAADWIKVIGYLPPPKQVSGAPSPPSGHKRKGTFVVPFNPNQIGYSTDSGHSWNISLDITAEVNPDDSLVDSFYVLNQAGDFFYAINGVRGLGNYVGTDYESEPYVIMHISRDGISWTQQTLFAGVDWGAIDPGSADAAFTGHHRFIVGGGVAYDEKSKRYMFAVTQGAVSYSVLVVSSDDGLSWGSPVTVAQGTTQSPPQSGGGTGFQVGQQKAQPDPLFAQPPPVLGGYTGSGPPAPGSAPGNVYLDFYGCGNPAGGNGYFVLPGYTARFESEFSTPQKGGVWVSDSSAASWAFQPLRSSGAPGLTAIYFKGAKAQSGSSGASPHDPTKGKGGFLVSVDTEGDLYNLFLSDKTGGNWKEVYNPNANLAPILTFALGPVGSWATDQHSPP